MLNGSLGPSPFEIDPARPAVFVTSGSGPYENTREALAAIDLTPARGKRVLLKPNAGRLADPAQGVDTHPEVVAAAIDVFREAGAEVAVGESPITGVKTLEAFERCGIKAVADSRDCPLIDMDARKHVRMKIPEGIAIKKLKLCPEVLEYDIIVSIPVMKMHMHTGVTLAVKNMKGCLWRRSKVELHMLPKLPDYDDKTLDIAIADMATVLRPHLSLVDGTVGLEGLGPSAAGQPKELGVVLTGVDAFAVDAVGCALMGVSAPDIPHLRMGAERGCGVIDLDSIDVSPGTWREAALPFDLPPENLAIEFDGVTVLDEQSCSACQSTLLLFLKRYGEELFGAKSGQADANVAIGKGHKTLPPDTLCIGNCTAKLKKGQPFIAGCPPVASEILNVYDEYFT